ncbi:TOG array regulator of axonemal microtubules protein 1 [Sergentomyia squamirostris]
MFFRRVFSRKPASSNGFVNHQTQDSEENPRFLDHKYPGSAKFHARRLSSGGLEDQRHHGRMLNVIQLTPLWEHIIRTGHLPPSLNVSDLFGEFQERLSDPEWQVRQHALRVLVDVLLVLGQRADLHVAPLMGVLVENLGHSAPAVRKGALDALRVYIAESAMPETVLLEIIDLGMEYPHDDPFGGRLTVGTMLSLPALVQATQPTPKRYHILRSAVEALLEKTVQITYQEVALKILLKIRDFVGQEDFYDAMPHSARRNFELLCNVYALTESPSRDSGIDLHTPSSGESKHSWKNPQKPLSVVSIPPSDSSSTDQSQDVQWKVTTNHMTSASPGKSITSEDGGCCKEMKNCSMEEIPMDDLPPAKIIMETEIKINQDTAVTMRILEADPNSSMETSMENRSHEDESEEEVTIVAPPDPKPPAIVEELEVEARRTPKRVHFGGEVVKMRTPDSDNVTQSDGDDQIRPVIMTIATPPSSGRSTPQIPSQNPSPMNHLSINIPNDNTKPTILRPRTATLSKNTPPTPPSTAGNSPDRERLSRHKSASPHHHQMRRFSFTNDLLSPKNEHRPIEVMHNLQRSPMVSPIPMRSRDNSEDSQKETPMMNNEETWRDETLNQKRTVKSWEDLKLVDESVSRELKSGDWRLRSRALYKLEDALRSTENLAAVQPYLDSLLRTLLSSERHPDVCEDKRRILANLISRLPLENLENRTAQIVMGLCRQGGPTSNSVAKSLMQRLPPAAIVLRLLSDEFLSIRSSKFRENALQMVLYALMTFPSTYFDVTTCVMRTTQAAIDRKKRVRQAALDVLAVLGQISSPKVVMDVVNEVAATRADGNTLSAAVKARLSRKQLPMIRSDGSIQYGLKLPSPQANFSIFGADIEWITAGDGSVSPTALKNKRSQKTTPPDDSNNRAIAEGSTQMNYFLARRMKMSEESGGGGRAHNDTQNSAMDNRSSRLKDDDRGTQFIVATAIPVHQQMPPISNGGFRSHHYQSHALQAHSFPELSKVSATGSQKTSSRPTQTTLEFMEIQRPSKLPVASRFPAMDSGRNGENSASKGANIDNPYAALSNRVSFVRIPNQKNGTMTDPQGTPNNQSTFAESHRPVTHPAFEKAVLTKRFSVPERLNAVPERQSHINHSGNKYQHTVTQAHMEAEQRPISGSGAKEGAAILGRFSMAAQPDAPDVVAAAAAAVVAEQLAVSPKKTVLVMENLEEEYEDRSSVTSSNGEKSSNLSPHSTPTRVVSTGSLELKTEEEPFAENDAVPSRAQSAHSLVDLKTSRTSSRPTTSHSLRDNILIQSMTPKSGSETRPTTPTIPPLESEVISTNSVEAASDVDETVQAALNVLEKRHALDEFHASSNLDSQIEDGDSKSTSSSQSEVGVVDEVDHVTSANERSFDSQVLPFVAESKSAPSKVTRPPILRRSRKVSPLKATPSLANCRTKSLELYPSTLRRFDKPKEAFALTLNQLESSSWESSMSGLKNFVRLIRHHPELVEQQIHLLAGTLAKHVRNLRSQVARAACQASGEFFTTHRKSLEQEADDLVTTLLHRTADTNKFLRSDATKALELMCENLTLTKVIHLLTSRGATHPNAIVRTTTAKLLTKVIEVAGYEKIFNSSRETRDKVIMTGANLLTEGSLETRNYAKHMFRLLSAHQNYGKLLLEIIPTKLYRNIEKTLKRV